MKNEEKEEYLKDHIPYSIRIMLAHLKFQKQYYPNCINDNAILESVFVGSLSKGRMLLEALGVKLQIDGSDMQIKPKKNKSGKDVWADDLGGLLIDISEYKKKNSENYEYLRHYLVAANKYELHLTQQKDFKKEEEKYNMAIPVIVNLVDHCFYLCNKLNKKIRNELIFNNELPQKYFHLL